MKNYFAPADIVRYTAPYAVNPGDGMLVGGLFGVACTTAASGEKTDVSTEGMYYLTSVSAETAAEGAAAYWDAGNRRVSVTTGTGIGHFPYGKGAGETSTRVRLQASPGSVSGAWNAPVGTRPDYPQRGLEILSPSGSAPTPSNGSGISALGALGATTIGGEQWWTITATADASGVNNYFELALTGLPSAFMGDDLVLEYQGNIPAGTILTPYIGTAGYAQFCATTLGITAPTGKGSFMNLGRRAMVVTANEWTKTGFTGAFASTPPGQMSWSVAKLRVVVPASTTCTIAVRSIRIGARKPKARICVTIDDGYSTVYQRAAPVFEAYGVPMTLAIIPNQIGTAGYMTESQLQDLKARKHLCVAHGPTLNLTNLFNAPYTTTAQRIADIQSVTAWLQARGLTTDGGAKCYVWPEGVYSSATGESDLLEAFAAAGYTMARGVGPLNGRGVFAGGISRTNSLRAVMPTIGHTYAGATNTPDDAAETTNINQIVTNINTSATDGTDVFLMLHKFVARGAATAGGIEIEVDRLATLLAAIQAKVAAGSMEAVTMDVFS